MLAPPELVKAIQSGDDFARAALADWFEEQGHPHADRARLMCPGSTMWDWLRGFTGWHSMPIGSLAIWLRSPEARDWLVPFTAAMQLIADEIGLRGLLQTQQRGWVLRRLSAEAGEILREHAWHRQSRIDRVINMVLILENLDDDLDPVATHVAIASFAVEYRFFDGQHIWSPRPLAQWWDRP